MRLRLASPQEIVETNLTETFGHLKTQKQKNKTLVKSNSTNKSRKPSSTGIVSFALEI